MSERIVIDTNVVVSSFFGGPPREIINRWRDGSMTWCLSQPIVEEYGAVLARMGLSPGRAAELFQLLAQGHHCLFTTRTPHLEVVERDADDNKFIECAVALNAKTIVSGDRDLLIIGHYFDIHILSPRGYLDRLSYPE